MTKLYIDCGHGGTDSGAIGNGLKEKDLTLKIGLKIKELLSKYKVDVKMSRETDKTVSLKDRTDDANKCGADYLLSIHINAGGGIGYEDFIMEGLKTTSETSKIRTIIHKEIMDIIDMNDRGKKNKDFHMLRESNMPAILTESGFIDNVNDAKKLKLDSYLDKIAEGHVNGLVKAFNLQNLQKMEVGGKTKQKQHIVRRAETLTKIAYIYGVSVDSIFQANSKIKNPNEIFVGDILIIPMK